MSWLKRKVYADLYVPPGINVDVLAERVANQIAKTVVHEAAHGKRWAEEYYTNKRKLDQMSRSEEEGYSERAELATGLPVELDESIFDESKDEQTISNRELLQRAIAISNRKNPFYIPPDAVIDVPLGGDWGRFQMVQRPGQPQQSQQTPKPLHVSWNEQNRKLEVDVDAIVKSFNQALMGIKSPEPPTYQDDGISPDIPGVSRQPPVMPSGQSAPNRAGIPGRSAVPSR